MSQEEISEIELNIKEARTIVDMGNALERLRDNKDFQKVIMNEYLEREAVRLVHLKADQNMQSDESQASILKQMDGIGSLTHFFQVVFQKRHLAEKAIESDEQTREELMSEDAE